MEAENNTQLPNSLETAAAAIADRCAHDPDWMAEFKANPRQVLQEMAGRQLPADLQIHLHQNDDDNWHVPIAGAGGKMTDDDLQRITGGEIVLVAMACVATGLGVAAGAAATAGISAGVIVSDKKKDKKK